MSAMRRDPRPHPVAALAALAAALLALALSASPAAAAPAPTFAEEFGGTSLDTNTWLTEAPWGTQWNQHELQWYDPSRLSFGSGRLRITTDRTTGAYAYSSGVITSRAKYSYGYFEMRAKLPKGAGVWPAFWLLADKQQEIDVLELVGSRPNSVEMYYHLGGKEVFGTWYTGPDFSEGYHTFAVDWQPTCIRWYIDGAQRAEYRAPIPPTPQCIIANTAVGDVGSFPGTPDSSTILPQRYDIDYIRYWPAKPDLPPSPPGGIAFSRIAGPDRYSTAVEVSKRAFPTGAPCVVVACGAGYADALAAAPLAKAYGGPVLLTKTSSLPEPVAAELRRLAPRRVFVAGSELSVSGKVEGALRAICPDVTRLAGPDRYGTAKRIAEELRAKNGAPGRVVLVNTFPDALSAAPLAAAKGWPILLTKSNVLPPPTAAAIAGSGAGASLVIGSEETISWRVKASLPSPIRIGGRDRYDTSSQLAQFSAEQGCSFAHVALATGADFPDGLVAAPYLARDSGMLLLTRPDVMPWPLTSSISANRTTIERLDAIGSEASVSEGILYEAAAALNWS